MNVNEAIEHANTLLIPGMLFFGGDEAVLSEISKNEEAIKVLSDAWMAEEAPGFTYDLVYDLVERNRELCEGVDAAVLEGVRSPNLPRGLPTRDAARALAALQHRAEAKVLGELNDGRLTKGAVYAGGRMSGTILGIDIETTSRYPDRGYIINVGWESMEIAAGAEPYGAEAAYCGLPAAYAEKGVPLEEIHHIGWSQIEGHAPFDADEALQEKLLALMGAHPYIAHNAAFEDSWFMLHLRGYAQARKAGSIVVVDSRDICRSLDPEVARAPFGSNPASLENWARRRGTLAAGEDERHNGLDDADLMLKTVLAELQVRNILS